MVNHLKKATIVLCATFVLGCNSTKDAQFEMLKANKTKLNFKNEPKQSTELNVLNYMYFFNGGGLAAGDFNNDGLIDLYFTANMGANRMFLNKGNMEFEDVTEAAGVKGTDSWTTGASVVDINNDGFLDIYVSEIGDYEILTSVNQLYVCTGIENGIPKFENQAVKYGLDLVGFSTQAAFFDYDQDGDLDMFQLNHSLHQNGTFGQRKSFEGKIDSKSGDKLLRNDSGNFVDVTAEAGLKSTVIGYGLGIVTGDINNDGWADIYVGNDFHENDYLYINQQDGTFKEVLTEQMMHTSRFSMGVDMGDINNDGQTEVISLDMLPSDPNILKRSLGEDGYDIFQFKIRFGYNRQFARNNLQLNNGNGTFSEIAMFSGIYATDWSWAPLFADFDNDGYKDLFVSNGIPRRMNDIDYANFQLSNQEAQMKSQMGEALNDKDLSVIERMPQIKIPNRFFLNDGNLKFKDLNSQVSGNADSYSNGAIYADLDNDGDLDIVVNNIDEEPFIYKNLNSEKKETKGSSLILKLKGNPQNVNAIGARLIVTKQNGQILSSENYAVRGFQSSAQGSLHLGIGNPEEVKNIYLIWPDRGYQEITNPKYNQTTSYNWQPALPKFDFASLKSKPSSPFQFNDLSSDSKLNFRHIENDFVEFNREPLIPYMVSKEGPALAVGDINGDGTEDVFFGSAKRERAAFYLQKANGQFEFLPQEFYKTDSIYEEIDAVLRDVDNDGDLDLVVASGGNEYQGTSEFLLQRLYLNDGKGNFTQLKNAFPNSHTTASCVLSTDINSDGLVDFFFGGRAVPNAFGEIPRSYLFINKGDGKFEDQTSSLAPALSQIGMVTGGSWADFDGDGDEDLTLAMDWDYVKIFRNDNGRLSETNISKTKGWWNFAQPNDYDGDGDLDLIVGNIGNNNRFNPDPEHPVRMYINDFDGDGRKEQILTYIVEGKEIPFATHADLTKRLVSLKKNYLFAKDMANASLSELFGKEKLANALQYTVNNSKSVLLLNNGDGTFEEKPLPDKLQFSSIETALFDDFDQNGQQEILTAGNFYPNNIEMGTYDADFGNMLSISGEGEMYVSPLQNLMIKGEVRRSAKIIINGRPCYILAKNNDDAQVLSFQNEVVPLPEKQ